MTICDRLFQFQDFEYRDFQSKLVPNISRDTMIGVRTPALREVAKEVFNSSEFAKVGAKKKSKDVVSGGFSSEEVSAFLSQLPHKYFEENLVHFFVVSMIKDFETCVREVERFLPFVDCWPVCDQSSPKIFKKNREKLLPFVKKWISSDHVYTARYGIRILMNEYLDEDFKPEYFDLVFAKSDDDYYLKMMVAWYFATALAKQYDAALPIIESHRLEPWTHNKAIQKALESFRVSDEHKEHLRGLKV